MSESDWKILIMNLNRKGKDDDYEFLIVIFKEVI